MKILHDIQDHYTKRSPIVLTIGFFDGMHLGHQQIFSKVRELRGENGLSYALSFSNHPRTYLKPDIPFPLISPLEQRVDQIKQMGIDSLLLLEFEERIKSSSADEFLSNLYEHLSFDHLVLGPDATIGHNKEGNVDLIQLLSKKFSFEFHLVPSVQFEKERISSTRIRAAIEKGQFDLVSSLLGSPYSLHLPVESGEQLGRKLGVPTLNLNVEGLALPPKGVYKVQIPYQGQLYLGAANLGFAPTLQERIQPVLEVHLLNFSGSIEADFVQVTFLEFIREEKKFSSPNELKAQIDLDIQAILA